MSMVTVHGPNTMYTSAAGVINSSPAGASATQDPNNGLKFTFALVADSPRANQDFSWAFPPDGTPSPQTVESPSVVTYASAGAKTATLTITNAARTISNKALTSNVATLTSNGHGFLAGQTVVVAGVDATFNGTYVITAVTANTFSYAKTNADVTSAAATGTATPSGLTPAAGAYTIAVTAVTGRPKAEQAAQSQAPPRSTVTSTVTSDEPEPEPEPEEPPEEVQVDVAYDPGAHTVNEVIAFAEENPEQVQDLLDAEAAGRRRTTLINHLEGML